MKSSTKKILNILDIACIVAVIILSCIDLHKAIKKQKLIAN